MFLVPTTRGSRQLSRRFDEAFERFLGPVTSFEGPNSIKVSVEGRQVMGQMAVK